MITIRTMRCWKSNRHIIWNTISYNVKITDNEVYKKLIFDTAKNLTKGEAISKAFKDHWAFPNKIDILFLQFLHLPPKKI